MTTFKAEQAEAIVKAIESFEDFKTKIKEAALVGIEIAPGTIFATTIPEKALRFKKEEMPDMIYFQGKIL
jgi:hypothetical protein